MMARTTGAAKPKAPTELRGLDYKGFRISRMSNGEVWFYEPEQPYYVALDVQTAKGEIDGMLDEKEEKPYTGKGHGGYLINPPLDCRYKVKFEGESPWWVDAALCHGTCKVNHHCETFRVFMEGARDRIKLLNTEKASALCPHCESHQNTSDMAGNVEYVCGSTYHRLSGTYTNPCKQPRRKRTT